MKALDLRFGKARVLQLDETGQVVTKDQALINREVKDIMIKANLIPTDK